MHWHCCDCHTGCDFLVLTNFTLERKRSRTVYTHATSLALASTSFVFRPRSRPRSHSSLASLTSLHIPYTLSFSVNSIIFGTGCRLEEPLRLFWAATFCRFCSAHTDIIHSTTNNVHSVSKSSWYWTFLAALKLTRLEGAVRRHLIKRCSMYSMWRMNEIAQAPWTCWRIDQANAKFGRQI